MKKLQLIIFTAVLGFSAGAYASVVSLIDAPVPKQSFESANSTPQPSAQSSATDDSAAQMKNVQAIMAKAKKEAQAGQLKSVPQSMVSYVKPAPKKAAANPVVQPVDVAGHSKLAHELESQMNQLNQVNKQYQQSTKLKIDSLQSQNKTIQSKLQKLTQAMLLMNQQLQTLNAHPNLQAALTKAAAKPVAKHKVTFSGLIKYIAFGMVALLAVMFGFLIARQKKQS